MKLEILLSALEGNVEEILDKLNYSSDILFVNQTDKNRDYTIRKEVSDIRIIETNTRGLSKSRNIAFDNAKGDILLICDDDVTYSDDYEEKILEAFNILPDADIIVFNIDRINSEWHNDRKFSKVAKASKFRTYGSVRIAIKKESYFSNQLRFDEEFGAGSLYASGEDSILLRDAHKKGMRIYTYPATIASVDFSESTWRDTKYDKIVKDKGALIARAFPRPYFIFKLYMAYAVRKPGFNIFKNYRLISEGVSEYIRDHV